MSKFSTSIQKTNNENIVKFIVNSFLTQTTSYEFNNIDDAQASPIAQKLFYFPFVKTVYISQNFIAIEKYNIVSWEEIQNEVSKCIEEYLNSGKSVISETTAATKTPVSVYAESTPNPRVMKFVANKSLTSDIFEFKNIQEAKHSLLARTLFELPFVKEIFISINYISITKHDTVEWVDVSMEIRELIRSHIALGKEILNDSILEQTQGNSKQITSKTKDKKSTTPIEQEIIAILDEYIKPAVAGDGGNIAFDSYNEQTQTVKVVLQGACSGCPSSTVTLKNGIETMLREMLKGKVSYVEAING